MKEYIRTDATIAKIFADTVNKYPNKTAILFEDEVWTFKEVEAYSNAVANYFFEAGYQKGDVVALFMDNRPKFICYWLGLSKIGVVAALINFNLKKQPLSHSITAAESKAVIFADELYNGRYIFTCKKNVTNLSCKLAQSMKMSALSIK